MKNILAAIVGAMAMVMASSIGMAGGKTHKVVIHVDQNNPKVMNMALNNVRATVGYYKKAGEKVEIEVVAYGPGLHMMRADTSPVAARIATMAMNPNIKFSGCGNTHRMMSKKAGKKVVLLDEAKLVPSGVVRLIQLQEAGYSYVRP